MPKKTKYSKYKSQIFAVKMPGKYPNAYVEINENGSLKLSIHHFQNEAGFAFNLNRRFARVLARRIDQALKASGPQPRQPNTGDGGF